MNLDNPSAYIEWFLSYLLITPEVLFDYLNVHWMKLPGVSSEEVTELREGLANKTLTAAQAKRLRNMVFIYLAKTEGLETPHYQIEQILAPAGAPLR
jgi:hypothetical protein